MKKYDEAFFRAKTNKRAKIAWLVLVIVACAYYAIKVYTGKIAFGYATIVAVTGFRFRKHLIKIMVNAPESTEGLINFIIIFYNGGYYGRFYFT